MQNCISNPQSLIPSSRSGISLLEVLISIFVLSIGLLGVAALIPIGKLALIETNKSDRTGACGRAALHDFKVRGMLNYAKPWQGGYAYIAGAIVTPRSPNGHAYLCTAGGTSSPTTEPTWPTDGTPVTETGGPTWLDLKSVFVVDPLGLTAATPLPNTLGPLARINFNWAMAALASQIFQWHDEMTFDMPKEVTARPRAIVQDSSSPVKKIGPYPDSSMTTPVYPLDDGNFSWFLTVSPSIQPGAYSVSAVVCYKRVLDVNNEKATTAGQTTVLSGPTGYGGVSIRITGKWPTEWTVKDNEWILLCSQITTTGALVQASWYRVANVGYDGTDTQMTLVGPDWLGGDDLTTHTFTAISIPGVTGVYTSTVQLN